MPHPPARDQTPWQRANAAYQLGSAGLATAERARKWWASRRTWTLTVRSDDPMYADVHAWLLATLPPDAAPRRLLARSADAPEWDEAVPSDPDSPRRGPSLVLSYDDKAEQTMLVEGHKVRVSVASADDAAVANGRIRLTPDVITLSTTTDAARAVVIEHLRHLVEDRADKPRRPVLWLLNSWGSWQRRADLPLRTLESVVMAPGQVERIALDLSRFLDAEPDYTRRGIPWHRGYLLHGPPGTGKTSLVKALAHANGLDLWYAPLNDLSRDASLLALLSEVRPRSMLLLEDVDSYRAAVERDGEHGQLSMAGLLNALDGVATPHGLVTVMTTNRPDVLDPALVRPGRVDLSEEFGLPDAEQTERLFEMFYGAPPPHRLDPNGATLADVTEVLKQHMHRPGRAAAELAAAAYR